jgi:uncharacterized membrane protein YccF (DUF307 family)
VTGHVVRTQQSGPGVVVRALWFVFIGWWLTGMLSAVAWVCLVSIVGLPLGIYIINRIPTFLTLRPRTRYLVASDVGGTIMLTEQQRPQHPWYVRGLWFVVIGWWLSAIWMGIGYVLVLLVLTLPIGLMMYNRVPAIASLYRY